MSILIKVNSRGVEQLLKSQGVQDDLKRHADKIAAAANANGQTDGFLADVGVGAKRARASVFTSDAEAMVAEATKRALTRAVDAGRG